VLGLGYLLGSQIDEFWKRRRGRAEVSVA